MHSFRKGLATELARSGVVEGVAQALLRHSDPRLTRNVYTDARLLPLAEAVSAVARVTGGSFPQSAHEGAERFDAAGESDDTRDVTSVTSPIMQQSTPGPSGSTEVTIQGLKGLVSSAVSPRSLPSQGSRGDQKCRRQESKLAPDPVSRVLTAAAELIASCAALVKAGSPDGAPNVQSRNQAS